MLKRGRLAFDFAERTCTHRAGSRASALWREAPLGRSPTADCSSPTPTHGQSHFPTSANSLQQSSTATRNQKHAKDKTMVLCDILLGTSDPRGIARNARLGTSRSHGQVSLSSITSNPGSRQRGLQCWRKRRMNG
eukprot:3938511-Rhodomonas_salina.1